MLQLLQEAYLWNTVVNEPKCFLYGLTQNVIYHIWIVSLFQLVVSLHCSFQFNSQNIQMYAHLLSFLIV